MITVALIAGMVGCGGGVEHDLTISSTDGGSVTTPGEDTYTYDEGEVVNLVATPVAGYYFGNWTGNVGTIADVNAATTTITMNGDYSITANFGVAYDLIITKTSGGSVTTPGEGAFPYAPGTVANMVATPDAGYQFVNWTGDVDTIADVNAATTTITMNEDYSVTANFGKYLPTISGGDWHTVGVETDNTVVATGYNGDGRCNVGTWTGITQVAAGYYHTVGLKTDGTVVAVGDNTYEQLDVSGWTGITYVAAGPIHTVGVKDDGTVAAVGNNTWGQCDVSGWTDIVQVAAGVAHTVGLKSDGTVVAVGCEGLTGCDQINVGGWTDIVQVAAGGTLTVGLRSDGTVVAVGDNSYEQLNVGGWTDIVQVAAGLNHALGVKSDGSVVAVGQKDHEQCDVSGWVLYPGEIAG